MNSILKSFLIIAILFVSLDSVVLAESASTTDTSQSDTLVFERDSAIKEVALKDNVSISEADGERISGRHASTKGSSLPLVLSILALLVSVLGFSILLLILRKQMESLAKGKDKSKDAAEERFEKLQSEYLSLEKGVKKSEAELNSKIAALDAKCNHLNDSRKQDERKSTVVSVSSEQVTAVNKKQPVTYSVFVQPQMRNDQIVLIECGEEQMSYLPFKLVVTDATAQVMFNEASLQYVLSDIETSIMNFTDCQIVSQGIPSRIMTTIPGTATKSNDYWILTKKPVLQIS